MWKLGYYYGAAYSGTYQFFNNYGFNADRNVNIFGAATSPTQKALADAIAAGNTAEVTKIKTDIKTILENYYISYAYTSEQIIPVDELLTMKIPAES